MPPSTQQTADFEATTAKINDLLAQSAEALTCGPDCQSAKNIQDLKVAYLAAQSNVHTAPHELAEAKKAYIIASEGQDGWSAEQERELGKKADELVAQLRRRFAEAVKKVRAFNDTYLAGLDSVHPTTQLFDLLRTDEQRASHKARQTANDMAVNDRKAGYEAAELHNLTDWYQFWFWAYIGLLVLYIVCCVLVPTQLRWQRRLGVIVILALFPWFIHAIIKWLIVKILRVYHWISRNMYLQLK